jgi:hypothetical protein
MVVEMVALQGLRVGLLEQQIVAVAVAVAVKEAETVAQVVPARILRAVPVSRRRILSSR